MKKNIATAKLKLKLETVKALQDDRLAQIVGGVTNPCMKPTTTVISTDC